MTPPGTERSGVDSTSVPEPASVEPPHEPRPAPAAPESTAPDPHFTNLPFRPARRYRRAGIDEAADETPTRYPARVVVPTILLAALLAHGLSVRSTFYFEDWTQVVANDWVDHGEWWQANLRALTYLTHWLTYALFGVSSPAFHAGNLLLHLLVAVLVGGFARQFLVASAGLVPERARRIGWWAGLLFAVHPLASEVVNYVRWRDLELVSLFSLLAARSALRWRRQRKPGYRWPVAMLLAVTAATFCKEVGFILAAGTAALVWFGTPRLPASLVRGEVAQPLPGPATRVKTKLVATPKAASMVTGNWPVTLSLTLVTVGVALLAWPAWQTAYAALHHPRFGWHTLTKARVFWMYLERVVLPVGLCSDHQIAWTVGWGDTVAWVAASAEAAVVAAGGFLYFRRSGATRAAGTLLAVALLGIVHRLANPNADLMVEARMYPALAPLCILLAWGLDRLLRWRKDGQEAPRPLLAASLMIALVAVGIGLSARRALVWRDTRTLVADIMAQYPFQARARQEIQEADVRAKYWSETLKDEVPVRSALESALAFNTRSPDRKYSPGPLLITHISSEGNYALALASLGRRREAFDHLAWIKKSVPTYGEVALACQAEYLFVLGLTSEAAQQEDAAVEALTRSERLTGHPGARRELRRISISKPKPDAVVEPATH